jgi:hypothetical protein
MRKPFAPTLREGKAEGDEFDFDIDTVVRKGNVRVFFVTAGFVIREEPLRDVIEGV